MISDPLLKEPGRPKTARRRTAVRKTNLRRFYAEVLSTAEKADLRKALKVEGVDEEIALLRLALRKAIEERPEDLELMFKGVDLIVRTVAARYRLSKKDAADFSDQMAGTVRLLADMLPEGLLDE